MTVGVYDNCYTCRNGRTASPGNKRVRLSSLRPDANMLRLPRNTNIADINIVVTACKR